MCRKILVVDDDPVFLEFLRKDLALHGHEVHASESGAGAVRILKRENFDFVVCDYFMPDGDGRWFYRALEKVKPNMVRNIIFVTGAPAEAEVICLLISTRCLFLQKPLRVENLIEGMDWLAKQKS